MFKETLFKNKENMLLHMGTWAEIQNGGWKYKWNWKWRRFKKKQVGDFDGRS